MVDKMPAAIQPGGGSSGSLSSMQQQHQQQQLVIEYDNNFQSFCVIILRW